MLTRLRALLPATLAHTARSLAQARSSAISSARVTDSGTVDKSAVSMSFGAQFLLAREGGVEGGLHGGFDFRSREAFGCFCHSVQIVVGGIAFALG